MIKRLANEPRFMPVIAAQQFLHRDGAAEPAIDRADDPAETAARVLAYLLVAIRIVDG